MGEHEVPFNILTLLTNANIDDPGRLYSFFREKQFPFLQFVNCCEWDAGALTDFSVRGEDVGRFYCALFDLWLKDGFPNVSIRLFEDILIYFIDGVHVSCCWMEECTSYLVVEHNGDCYPCDFFVHPAWKLGNITSEEFPTISNSPLRKRFSYRKTKLPKRCRKCELLSFCNGDCSKFRGGDFRESSGVSEYCTSLKMLVRHMQPHLPYIREAVMKIRQEGRRNSSSLTATERGES